MPKKACASRPGSSAHRPADRRVGRAGDLRPADPALGAPRTTRLAPSDRTRRRRATTPAAGRPGPSRARGPAARPAGRRCRRPPCCGCRTSPSPAWVSAVSPKRSVSRSTRTPSASATICASTVSTPWPIGIAPLMTVMLPSDSTRTAPLSQPADGVLDEGRDPDADQLAARAALGLARPQPGVLGRAGPASRAGAGSRRCRRWRRSGCGAGSRSAGGSCGGGSRPGRSRARGRRRRSAARSMYAASGRPAPRYAPVGVVVGEDGGRRRLVGRDRVGAGRELRSPVAPGGCSARAGARPRLVDGPRADARGCGPRRRRPPRPRRSGRGRAGSRGSLRGGSRSRRTGRPSLRASAATATSSRYVEPLAPKPPPRSGTITRTLCCGRPSATAMSSRSWWGVWRRVPDGQLAAGRRPSARTGRAAPAAWR